MGSPFGVFQGTRCSLEKKKARHATAVTEPRARARIPSPSRSRLSRRRESHDFLVPHQRAGTNTQILTFAEERSPFGGPCGFWLLPLICRAPFSSNGSTGCFRGVSRVICVVSSPLISMQQLKQHAAKDEDHRAEGRAEIRELGVCASSPESFFFWWMPLRTGSLSPEKVTTAQTR